MEKCTGALTREVVGAIAPFGALTLEKLLPKCPLGRPYGGYNMMKCLPVGKKCEIAL